MILEIVLLLLKILGIILLVVLCLALLLLLYPIKYVGNGEVDDKTVTYGCNAWWLFHIIHFHLEGENQKRIANLRLFGIPIYKMDSEKQEEEEEKKEPKTELKKTKSEEPKEETQIPGQRQISDFMPEIDLEADAEERQKISLKEKIKKVCWKVKELWGTVKEAYGSTKETATIAKEKLDNVKKVLKAKYTKRAYQYVKEILKKLLEHIKPRKVEGELKLGMEEPDQTGKVLGYISMGCAMFRIPLHRMNITPDFEKKVLKGNIYLKGRFLLGIVLVYLLKLYFNRDVKRVMRRLGI